MENYQSEEIENIDVSIPVPWGHVAGRWYGNRDVRPILALHGWLDNLGTWNNLVPLLPKHIGIVCVDLPGHGRSSKLPKGIPYSDWQLLSVLLHIMKAYNWKKVSLLGHSMGAHLSIMLAAIYPHIVDLIITIDVVGLRDYSPIFHIEYIRFNIEKFLIEDDRQDRNGNLLTDPPSYVYDQLEKLLHDGSERSVDLKNCKHILERNIVKSKLYPDKYCFSRDGRAKYQAQYIANQPLNYKVAERMRTIPYCMIKASESNISGENDREQIIALLRRTNRNFEFHLLSGTHHVHLNNAAEVAATINPFINRYRPPLVESWSLDSHADEHLRKIENQNGENKRSEAKSKL